MFKKEKSLDEKWYEITRNSSFESEVEYQQEINLKACSLENRINEYIKWYSKNILAKYDSNEKEFEKQKLRDFIEKMAIWYELRYPDLEIDNLTNLKDFEFLPGVYDYNAFYNELSNEEQLLLISPSYPEIIYLKEGSNRRFHLSSDGVVQYSEYNGFSHDRFFQGKNIEDVQKYFKERGIIGSELDKIISNYKKDDYKKEGLLNSVMYRIIERGGILGAKRAFLFAKEFKRDISIPIRYLVSEDNLIYELDEKTKNFINEYLRLGGSIYTPCYPNYHMKSKNIGVVSLIDIISNSSSYLGDDKNLIKLRVLNLVKNILIERQKEFEFKNVEFRKIEGEKVYQKRLER